MHARYAQTIAAFGEQRNHVLKYESDCVSIGIGIKIWIVEEFARDCFVVFLSFTPQSNQNILSIPEQFFIPAVSHMKIANVHIGNIHQNVRIALQFSYQFAIFISVCIFHISLQFSHFGVYFLRGRLQFSYEFAIFIWVCNFHISLQFSCHASSTYLRGFAWILCHYGLELINSTSATVLCGRQR